MKQGSTCSRAASWVLVCTLFASPAIFAQVYTWTDENGVTHFSQLPPPAGQEAALEEVPDFTPPDGENSDAGLAGDDMSQGPADAGPSPADLERQQIARQYAQRRADQAELDAACNQARERLAQIEPSRRVFYQDENGETTRWDDEERVAAVQQLHDFLDENCR